MRMLGCMYMYVTMYYVHVYMLGLEWILFVLSSRYPSAIVDNYLDNSLTTITKKIDSLFLVNIKY